MKNNVRRAALLRTILTAYHKMGATEWVSSEVRREAKTVIVHFLEATDGAHLKASARDRDFVEKSYGWGSRRTIDFAEALLQRSIHPEDLDFGRSEHLG